MRLERLSVLGLGLLLAAVSGGGTTGCQYDPHPINGALRCSPSGECPDGFSCQASRCWSNAPDKDGGSGADIVPTTNISDYIGEWLLTTAATVKTSCTDGFSATDPLSPADSPSTMTVSQGTGSDGLLSSWLCDLTLRVDATGAHLNDANPSCTDTSGDPAYTWTASKFDIVVASNGKTAMHTATYKRRDDYVAGTVTNCDQVVSAPMTKQ